MEFRAARHTSDLERIETFYTQVVGLQKLGSFQNHAGYDGIFLGHLGESWHLEFTSSNDSREKGFDEDDLLVFYCNSRIEFEEIGKHLAQQNIPILEPRNPYWKNNGILIEDPDGYKIIFAIKPLQLSADDELTRLVRSKNIDNWSDLLDHVKNLPYGRNANREDFSLVLKEAQGSCSSKHSLLKKVAQLNSIGGVKLMMGMYKMNHVNTPKIGNILIENGLEYIPEAHCYLMLNNRRYDLTSSASSIHHLIDDVLEEIEIQPEQVNTFKVDYHKQYMQKWIEEKAVELSFDRVWEIREQCIKRMGG